MTTTYIQPNQLFRSEKYGFSQVSVSEGSKIISLAGQVATDADENILGEGDLLAQTTATLRNIENALTFVDAGLSDISSMRIYVVPDLPTHASMISDALIGFFEPNAFPPSSWIGVSSLARPEFLIEIEVSAVIQKP